jgi:hypothetical protein
MKTAGHQQIRVLIFKFNHADTFTTNVFFLGKVHALSVSPAPIHFPGVLTINAAGILMIDVNSPISVCAC